MKTYNVLIVEDEIPAQTNLRRLIETHFPDLRTFRFHSCDQSVFFVLIIIPPYY